MLYFHIYYSANTATSHQSSDVRAQAKSNVKCNLIGPRRFSSFKHVRGKHLTPVQGNCKGCCKWTTLQISKKWIFFIIVFIYLQCSHFKFIARSNQESWHLKKNICRRRSEWTFPTLVSHWFRLCVLVSISRHIRNLRSNLGNNHLRGVIGNILVIWMMYVKISCS